MAIGDAVVDGATIEWEKHEQFEGLSAEEKGALTVKEYEELEQRMEKNAWMFLSSWWKELMALLSLVKE